MREMRYGSYWCSMHIPVNLSCCMGYIIQSPKPCVRCQFVICHMVASIVCDKEKNVFFTQ